MLCDVLCVYVSSVGGSHRQHWRAPLWSGMDHWLGVFCINVYVLLE